MAMPSLRTSASGSARCKNTQQITKAMKMVAAVKLRRAQERHPRRAPLRRRSSRTCRSPSSRPSSAEPTPTSAHPLPSRAQRAEARPSRGRDHRPRPVRRLQRQHHPPSPALRRRRTGQVREDRAVDAGRKRAKDFWAAQACRSRQGLLGRLRRLRPSTAWPTNSPKEISAPVHQGQARRGLPRSTTTSIRPCRSEPTVRPALPDRCRTAESQGPSRSRRLHLRAGRQRDPGRASCRATWQCSSARPAGIQRLRARRPHGGHGRGQQERRRDDLGKLTLSMNRARQAAITKESSRSCPAPKRLKRSAQT